MFHIGQQVVCIQDDDWHSLTLPECPPSNPVKNLVYTVAGFVNHPVVTEFLALRLEEISPGWAFDSSHFRPVRKTSIEVFQKLLAPTPEKELV